MLYCLKLKHISTAFSTQYFIRRIELNTTVDNNKWWKLKDNSLSTSVWVAYSNKKKLKIKKCTTGASENEHTQNVWYRHGYRWYHGVYNSTTLHTGQDPVCISLKQRPASLLFFLPKNWTIKNWDAVGYRI